MVVDGAVQLPVELSWTRPTETTSGSLLDRIGCYVVGHSTQREEALSREWSGRLLVGADDVDDLQAERVRYAFTLPHTAVPGTRVRYYFGVQARIPDDCSDSSDTYLSGMWSRIIAKEFVFAVDGDAPMHPSRPRVTRVEPSP